MNKEYFLIADSIEDLELKAIANEELIWSPIPPKEHNFVDNEITVKHQDGSEFKIKHAHFKWASLRSGIECLIVYPEHNSNMIFAIEDLDYFIVNNFNEEVKFIVLNGKEFNE